jgi:hypothetical protein
LKENIETIFTQQKTEIVSTCNHVEIHHDSNGRIVGRPHTHVSDPLFKIYQPHDDSAWMKQADVATFWDKTCYILLLCAQSPHSHFKSGNKA